MKDRLTNIFPWFRKETVRAFNKGVLHVLVMLVAIRAIDFILSIILARVLGPVDVGHLGVINSILSIGLVVAGFGLPTAITKYVAEKREISRQRAILGQSARLGFGSSLIAAIVIALILLLTRWVPDDTAARYIWFLLPAIPFLVFNDSIVHFIYGLGKIKEKTYVELGMKGLFAVLVIFLLSLMKLRGVILAKLLHPLIFAFLFLPFFIRNQKSVDRLPMSPSLLRFGGLSASADLASTLVRNFDILAISYFLGSAEIAGIYRVSALLARSLDVIPEAAIHALYPDISRLTGDKESLKKVFWKLFGRVALIMVPVCFIAYLAAPWLLVGLFGNDFAPGIGLFQVLLITPFIFAFLRIFGNIFSATGRPDLSLVIVVLAGIANVFLCFFLVPDFGAMGAAWAVNLTYLLNFVASFLIMTFYLQGFRVNEKQ